MTLKKYCWIALGCIGLGLGALGSVLPMIPSVPFLVLATISFSKSSERMHQWFVGTSLYKNNLETVVEGLGMTRQAKKRIMMMVTALMGIGFVMMFNKALYIPCAILVGIWVLHLLYFKFGIKTYQPT